MALARIVIGRIVWNRYVFAVLVVLFVTTAVFDSLIVSSGIVDYDTEQILGITIGTAPIEDFFYALLAGLLIPSIWHYLRGGEHAAD